ncbi:MAG: MoaD/ThiS family protein [Anaerolineae bacterium]|nr:MoaD/ThiS family protein [Anaerolineae bacterium]
MKVNFFASLRTVVGAKTVLMDLKGADTVRTVMDRLFTLYPGLQARMMDQNDDLFPHVHVFVNGRDILTLPENMDMRLSPEDQVDIFPPVAGGSGVILRPAHV